MAYEIKERKIGKHTYKVTPFSALEALRLKAKLVTLLGPGLGRMLGTIDTLDLENALNTKFDGEALGNAVQTLMGQLTEDEFEGVVKRLLKGTSAIVPAAEGKQVMISFEQDFSTAMDLAFQQNLLEMYKVVGFVLEVNYPDFFEMAAGIGKRFQTIGSKPVETEAKS